MIYNMYNEYIIYLNFVNQKIRQLELSKSAQWEILPLVPEEVLWQKWFGGLGAEV